MELWFGHGCSGLGHACSGRRMLLETERNGLSMDALVTDRVLLATRTELRFGHGCSGHRVLSELKECVVWAWMLWSSSALGARTELWFGHACSGYRVLLEHEQNYGSGMDALVTDCSWNANGMMVWAWMLWSPYALNTRTELCFGHGCSGRHAFNARSARGILRLELQSPSFLDVLTIRRPRLCTVVWLAGALTREAAVLFKKVHPR